MTTPTGTFTRYPALVKPLPVLLKRQRNLEAQIATVESSVNAALTAVGCGHDVPNGKVIDFDLSTQCAVFYNDGCVAGSSSITSGRAG